LLGVAVYRAQQRVDVDECLLLDPGQQLGALGQRNKMLTQHRLELAGMPEGNSRNSVPSVDGAYTPSNNVGIPPERSTSRSSMLSAPAHVPAITLSSFAAGFAAPDLIRG
jgi:hypothetical protein